MNQSYGLVLCGGGAKGAYQMGVLKALEELGCISNLCGISGASIGSLNALAISCCGTEVGMELWNEIEPLHVFDIEESDLDGTEGIFSRNGMRDLLNRYIQFDRLKDVSYPIYASVTPVNRIGCEVEYIQINDKSKEDVLTIMEATSALPVIYKEVQYGGVAYRDGGICDNMPIRPLYDQGCREFIVLSLSNDDYINEYEFPGATFHLIKPYKDLGGLLTGTLNFEKESILTRLQLGYKDGLRYGKAYILGDTQISEHYNFYADMDYEDVLLNMRKDTLQADIDSELNYIANLEEKYKIDW